MLMRCKNQLIKNLKKKGGEHKNDKYCVKIEVMPSKKAKYLNPPKIAFS